MKAVKRQSIRTLIFDWGGVCFTDGTGRAIEDIAATFSLPRQAVAKVLQGELGSRYRKGELGAAEFWQQAAAHWKIRGSRKSLERLWLEGYEVIPGTVALIRRLKLAGYEVLFLSDNVPERVHYLEERYAILQLFDGGVFSYQVKLRKPNQALYALVLKRASHAPKECLYIDDVADFLEPARRLGMRVLRFSNPEQLERDLRKLGVFGHGSPSQ